MTFYAGVALVPSLLVALAVIGLGIGEERLQDLGDSLAAALPDPLGAPEASQQAINAALGLSPLGWLVAVVPATLYGEGLRRAFLAQSGSRETLTGWRGRARILPLLGVAPALLLAVLLVTPVLADLLGEGSPGSVVLGVWLALTVDWLALWVALAYVYRAVGQRSPGWGALVYGSGVTAAFTSGFVQGFVLFLSLPIDLGAPFGGLTGVGVVVALGFWLWLLHLVTLVGYAGTLTLDGRWRSQPPS